ncbi:MAG: flagellar hook capping protein [Planctomycetes bacterium]|nr:flagellar hook capping protein [Planctomycetota bacterium]
MADSVTAASSTGTTTSSTGTSRGLEDMSGMDFLKLLITQLSNQDPMEPMKNQELLEQLSAIRSLESNMTISEKFEDLLSANQSLATQQELSSATLLMGTYVTGLSTANKLVQGYVDRVIVNDSGTSVQVGDYEIPLENVRQVGWSDATDE